MGAVQRLATVVIIGLVALSTILVLYAADEPNRIVEADQSQQEIEVERSIANYIQYCLSCHGPAGEGYAEGTGRLGMPLGGNTSATQMNQEGINAQGTPYSGGLAARRDFLVKTIHNGRGSIMPAWGQENGGQLNDEQIQEIVTMIMNVDWNEVYNTAIESAGGYPTVAPTEAATAPAAASKSDSSTDSTEAPASAGLSLTMHDTYFDPTSITIPSNTATTIHITNEGATTHNFSIPDLNISVDLEAGSSQDVEIPATAAGEYDFDCDIPGHKEAGMVGKLIVSDDAAVQTAPVEASPVAESTAATADVPAPVTITMGDTFFDPTTASIPAGTATTITLVNNGATLHNFSIGDLDISVDVDAGATQTVEINAPAGSYTFHCDIPGHTEAGMTGTLTVE